jgi:conjugative transposon TraM protein
MKKINWKSPKYIIPLIMLPFLFIGYFAYGVIKNKKGSKEIAVTTIDTLKGKGSYNTDLPSVSKDVENKHLDDKFQVAANLYKNQTGRTGINALEQKDQINGPQIGDIYSDAEARNIDSRQKMKELEKQMQTSQSLMNDQIRQTTARQNQIARRNTYNDNPYSSRPSYGGGGDDIESIIANAKRQTREIENYGRGETEQPKDQMAIFREQMQLVDSMQRATEERQNPNKRKNPPAKKTIPKSEQALPVAKADKSAGSSFNTVSKTSAQEKDDEVLRAVIDEDGKVFAGSRMRFRLLQPITVGKYVIPKNTFVYGNVVGFQAQRINIKIEEILFNNLHLPVEIDIFDNDGYLGLYVPGSNFREFTRDIGRQSSQGIANIQVMDGTNESLKASLIKQLFTSGSNSISKLVTQQKANIKYNYIVILKPKTND